jgi:hypothetical protein
MWCPDPNGEYAYVVSGNTFYRIQTNYNVQVFGYVSGTGPVSMSDKWLASVFIATNPDGYIYNMNTQVFGRDPTAPISPARLRSAILTVILYSTNPNSQRVLGDFAS